MTLKTQAKVLRALQEQRVEPVGGTATVDGGRARDRRHQQGPRGRDPQAARFREDLFFRLNVIPFHVPPLRERREDVPLPGPPLHGRDLRRVRPAAKEFSAGGAWSCSRAHKWPGNVRELRNIVERLRHHDAGRARRRAPPARVAAGAAPDAPAPAAAPAAAEQDFPSLADAREDFEKRYIWRKYRSAAAT